MNTNVGTIDRILRIAVGLALLAAAVGFLGPVYQTVWSWIGLIPLATGLVGWCPLYTVFGFKTCRASTVVTNR